MAGPPPAERPFSVRSTRLQTAVYLQYMARAFTRLQQAGLSNIHFLQASRPMDACCAAALIRRSPLPAAVRQQRGLMQLVSLGCAVVGAAPYDGTLSID